MVSHGAYWFKNMVSFQETSVSTKRAKRVARDLNKRKRTLTEVAEARKPKDKAYAVECCTVYTT